MCCQCIACTLDASHCKLLLCGTPVPVAIWSSLQHVHDGNLPFQINPDDATTGLGLIGPASCSTNTGRYNLYHVKLAAQVHVV